MSSNATPLPVQDRLTDANGRITLPWLEFLTAQGASINQSAARVTTVRLANRTASIGTTPIPSPSLSAGLYRVSVYARITRAASVSSSLIVTVGWTELGLSLLDPWPAVTGNTVTSVLTSPPKVVQIDGATPVSYATTYVSVGGTTMEYELMIVLERIDA